ncbi:MAG: hypothetical protein QGG40_22060, partial [Myxococcota bacterium]|nr:hypothetical protein [Myxococcota bacterium]
MRIFITCLLLHACSSTEPERTDRPALDPRRQHSGQPDTQTDTSQDSDTDTSIPEPSDSAVDEDPVDCDLISLANSAWEVCETSDTECAGVFTDGAGCQAYCAAAGLECTNRYGGEPGCQKEPENVIDCDTDNGHESDWCTCGPPDEESTTEDSGCES